MQRRGLQRGIAIMAAPPAVERKNIRLPAEFYRGRRLYFLTLCFHQRRRYGANPCLASWLISRLRTHSAACGFFVHAYCVMPDHMHILAAATADESNLIKFVESFKQDTPSPLLTARAAASGNSNIMTASCAPAIPPTGSLGTFG